MWAYSILKASIAISWIDPASAIVTPTIQNKIKFSTGLIFEISNKLPNMSICIKAIQLFLWPYLARKGTGNLSTMGAQINLKVYEKVIQVKKPI